MSQAMMMQEKQEQKLLEKEAEKQLIKEVYASEGLKQPPVKENRSLAKAVLAIVVALSLVVVAPVKLSVRRNSLMKELQGGKTTSTLGTNSVKGYVRKAASESKKMTDAIRTALRSDPSLADEDELNKLENLIDRIDNEEDAAKLIVLNKQLVNQTNSVYTAYQGEKGKEDKSGIYSGHRSAVITTQDEMNEELKYWKKAAAFNTDRSAFPANIMSAIYGIKDLPVN